MKVLNRHEVGIPPGAVYVGRGSPWGNPFTITKARPRDLAIREYERYARRMLIVDPHWLDGLRGKDLVCYCSPLPCHGDVLVRLVKEFYGEDHVTS